MPTTSQKFNLIELEKEFPFFKFSDDLDPSRRIEEYGILVTEIDKRYSEENRFGWDAEIKIQEMQENIWRKLNESVDQYFADHCTEVFHEIRLQFKAYTSLADGLDTTRYFISKQCLELGKYLSAHNESWKPESKNDFVKFGGGLGQLAIQGTIKGLEGISKLTAKDNVSPEHENPPLAFIKRILDQHFSDKQLDKFINDQLSRIQTDIGKEWEDWLINYSSNISIKHGMQISIEWSDPSFEIAKAFGLGTVGGTIALAMGWHTLAWSVANFFPPALIAAGALTAGWAFLTEEKTKKSLVENADKSIGNLKKELQRVLAVEAMPAIRFSLNSAVRQAKEITRNKLWGGPEDPKIKVEKWRPILIASIDEDEKRWTFAQAEHMMKDAFEKGSRAVEKDEVEKAILYFSLSFDGFVHWSHRKTNIDLNTYETSYLSAYEKRFEARGWETRFLKNFRSVRRLRNDGIHDYYKQDKNAFSKVIKIGYVQLGELIQAVKEKCDEK